MIGREEKTRKGRAKRYKGGKIRTTVAWKIIDSSREDITNSGEVGNEPDRIMYHV